MLLFVFTGDGVLVTEDEVNFGAGAGEIRTKCDCPRCLVTKRFAVGLETFLKEFSVSATTIASLQKPGLILDDKRLCSE